MNKIMQPAIVENKDLLISQIITFLQSANVPAHFTDKQQARKLGIPKHTLVLIKNTLSALESVK